MPRVANPAAKAIAMAIPKAFAAISGSDVWSSRSAISLTMTRLKPEKPKVPVKVKRIPRKERRPIERIKREDF